MAELWPRIRSLQLAGSTDYPMTVTVENQPWYPRWRQAVQRLILARERLRDTKEGMQARTEAEREYEAAWSVARRQNEMMAYVAVRLLGHAERAHGFAIACDGAAMRLGQAEARGPWEDYARGAWNNSIGVPQK